MLTTTLRRKHRLSQRRRWRVRKRVIGTALRPRLAFHKSLKHLCAQLIDDAKGHTLLAVTTDSKAMRATGKKSFRNVAQAKALGERLGALAKERGLGAVVFDRGGHPYHGVVKAFAEAVRAQGIKF
jgi:large subunit ribosomal protein L18